MGEAENNVSYRQLLMKTLNPSYLSTISMSELYENIYDRKPPIIDELLYSGTYLFVGAPKVGKSFFMLQLAYHISTGTQLWNYPINKGTVLYIALEDDYCRLQERLYRMFGTENAPGTSLIIPRIKTAPHLVLGAALCEYVSLTNWNL